MQDFCPKKVGLVTDSLDLIDSYDYSKLELREPSINFKQASILSFLSRCPTDSSNSGPLVTSRLRVCKLLQRIHSTVPCLATIGVSASSAQPSHCLRLAAISARASSAHPLISVRASSVHLSDSLCHRLRPAIISARASSVHLSSLQELRRRITAFVLRPSA
nr:hypothetical protein CFP56_43055 [Quercus suber]